MLHQNVLVYNVQYYTLEISTTDNVTCSLSWASQRIEFRCFLYVKCYLTPRRWAFLDHPVHCKRSWRRSVCWDPTAKTSALAVDWLTTPAVRSLCPVCRSITANGFRWSNVGFGAALTVCAAKRLQRHRAWSSWFLCRVSSAQCFRIYSVYSYRTIRSLLSLGLQFETSSSTSSSCIL